MNKNFHHFPVTHIGVTRPQKGIALLTALLVVALATIIAVNITERQQYDIRRMENILFNQQAYYYALGGEAWAVSILTTDSKSSSHKKTDNLFEDWAQPLPPTPIEGGMIAGKIDDLQGRFNLNNLYIKDRSDAAALKYLKEQQKVFERLLVVLKIDPRISMTVIDWLDADGDASFPDGAEDAEYLALTPSYRSANQRMSNISELLLVKGISYEIFLKLKPFVCALPANTTININTASAEVIAALSSQLDLSMAKNIIEDRTAVISSNKDFLDTTKSYVRDKTRYELEITPLIGVSSQYFQVQATVQIDKINKNLISILQRNSKGEVIVIARNPGAN